MEEAANIGEIAPEAQWARWDRGGGVGGELLNEREVAEVPMALNEMKRMMVDNVDDGGECRVRNLNGLRLSLKFFCR